MHGEAPDAFDGPKWCFASPLDLMTVAETSTLPGDRWARGTVVGLALALLLVPFPSFGQDSPVASLVERGRSAGGDATLLRAVASRAEQARISEEATAGLLGPPVRLAEQNFPARPLLNRALEGLAKQVPPTRMKPVLEELQAHVEQAGALVSTWLTQAGAARSTDAPENGRGRDDLIVATAEAHRQGIPFEGIRQFLGQLPSPAGRRSVPAPKVAAAVRVMPELPTGNGLSEAGRQVLVAALAAGYDARALQELPAALRRAERGRERPQAAIVRSTARAIAQGAPSASLLGQLSQGTLPGGGAPPGIGTGPPGTLPGLGKPPGPGGVPPGIDPPAGPDPVGERPVGPRGASGP